MDFVIIGQKLTKIRAFMANLLFKTYKSRQKPENLAESRAFANIMADPVEAGPVRVSSADEYAIYSRYGMMVNDPTAAISVNPSDLS